LCGGQRQCCAAKQAATAMVDLFGRLHRLHDEPP
jgi:hypothetical protein